MTPAALIALIVKRRAAYADVGDADLDRFANDFIRQNDRTLRFDKRLLSVACGLPRLILSESLRGIMPVRIRNMLEVLERTVVSDFLMAVDFFNPRPVGERLRYGGLKSRGFNVFARFD